MSRRWHLVIALLPVAGAMAGEADHLRDALRENAPPWYDASADGWRRIEVREPEAAKSPSSDGGGLGVQLVAILLLVGLVAAIVWVVWQLRKLSSGNAEVEIGAPTVTTRAAPDLSLLPLPDAGLPPDEGLRRALANQDWHRAVVWVHAKLLMRLDHAGALRLEKGATDGQLLEAARRWAAAKPGRRSAVSALERTGSAFAAVYFGHATADRALVDTLLAADVEAARVLVAEGA